MIQAAPSAAGMPDAASRHMWRRILGLGLLTYILVLVVFAVTGNTNLFPTILWIGNFLIPVTYVVFFYGRREHSNVTLATLLETFFLGGVLGTLVAALIEPHLIAGLRITIPVGIEVGVVEEWAKLLGVLLVVRRWRRFSELDGIIIGAAAGMGFAAIESSGYAFRAFLDSGGKLTLGTALVVGESMLRGVFAPLTHGTWTALLVSVMFREQGAGWRGVLKVSAAYLLVVLLHGLWDGASATVQPLAMATPSLIVVIPVVMLGVGMLGLVLLWRRLREARRLEQAGPSVGRSMPSVAAPGSSL